MSERRDAAVLAGAYANTVLRLGTVGLRVESLHATDNATNGPANAARGNRDNRRASGHRPLRAERSTDVRTDNPDIGRVDLQLPREFHLPAGDILAWFIHGELIALPHRRGRKQFNWIVVLCWRRVFLIDLHRSTRPGGVEVACLRVLLKHRAFPRRGLRLHACRSEAGAGPFVLIVGVD